MIGDFSPGTTNSVEPTEHTRENLSLISERLVRMYEGNQVRELLEWLGSHIKNAAIRRRYYELAVFHNITRLLVDRVSTVGEASVRWISKETRQTDISAQDRWDEINSEWMTTSWETFVPALNRRTELLKTIVAGVEWDPWNEKLALCSYGPAEVDVSYAPENANRLEPDRFHFLHSPNGVPRATWDFSSREKGPSGLWIQRDEEPVPLPVIDVRTGRSAIPFVPFRTLEGSEYFVWDGQEELRNAQEFVNRLYTRISVLTEMGTNKVMVLSGGGWVDADGQMTPIPLDITQAIKEPEDGLGESSAKPKIRWDGPEVASEIGAALDIVSHWVEATAATFRINASAIRAKNEATSGYALQIESAALRAKHDEVRRTMRRRLERVVRLIQLYWDTYGPREMRFGAGVYPIVDVQQFPVAVTTREEVEADIALVGANLKRRLPVIYRYEPSIPPAEAERLAASGSGMAINPGIASGDADPNVAVAATATAEPDPSPVVVTAAAEGIVPAADVQSQVLNGAQMSSLQSVVQAVADKTLPADSAIALVMLAVPGVSIETARGLVTPADKFIQKETTNVT